jgi:hypothetical protein
MADAFTVPPNDTIASKLLISGGILVGIVFPIYIARMYSRCYPTFNLRWDDYTISIAEVSACECCRVVWQLRVQKVMNMS